MMSFFENGRWFQPDHWNQRMFSKNDIMLDCIIFCCMAFCFCIMLYDTISYFDIMLYHVTLYYYMAVYGNVCIIFYDMI